MEAKITKTLLSKKQKRRRERERTEDDHENKWVKVLGITDHRIPGVAAQRKKYIIQGHILPYQVFKMSNNLFMLTFSWAQGKCIHREPAQTRPALFIRVLSNGKR